jgi:hypothetical protein
MVSTVTDPIEAALAEMESGICNCPAPRQGGWCGAGGSLDKPRLIAALRVAVEVIENAGDSNLHLDDTHWREYILRALRGEGE